MANKVEKIARFIISFFAMLVTLLSFALLSLQILFISLVWIFTSFLYRLNCKLSSLNYKWN